GNPQEITILEFAEKVRKRFDNAPPIIFEPLPQDDPKQRCPDITKAKRILQWEPKVNLEEGLRSTMAYFKETFAKRAMKEQTRYRRVQPLAGAFSAALHGFAPERIILEAEFAHPRGRIKIPSVHDQLPGHQGARAFPIQIAVFVPFRADHRRFRPAKRFV